MTASWVAATCSRGKAGPVDDTRVRATHSDASSAAAAFSCWAAVPHWANTVSGSIPSAAATAAFVAVVLTDEVAAADTCCRVRHRLGSRVHYDTVRNAAAATTLETDCPVDTLVLILVSHFGVPSRRLAFIYGYLRAGAAEFGT